MPAPFDCHITELDDDLLADLAREWRGRALHGDKEANGTAHALEAEERSRHRHRQVVAQEAEAEEVQRPRRWHFWIADRQIPFANR